jgi:hypothetical protein
MGRHLSSGTQLASIHSTARVCDAAAHHGQTRMSGLHGGCGAWADCSGVSEPGSGGSGGGSSSGEKVAGALAVGAHSAAAHGL